MGEEGKGGRMGENRAKRRGRRKMGEDGRGGDGGEMMGEEGNRKGGEVREEGQESWGRKKKWERDQRGRLREGGGKGKRDGRGKGEMKECRGWGWGYTAQASGTYSITTVNFCRHDNRVRVHACSHNCAECLVRIHGPRPACWSGGTRG